MKNKTTADLRESLFDTMEKVKTKEIDPKQAAQVANVAKTIIDSARLELDHSKVLSKLDKDDQKIVTGPILLTVDKNSN